MRTLSYPTLCQRGPIIMSQSQPGNQRWKPRHILQPIAIDLLNQQRQRQRDFHAVYLTLPPDMPMLPQPRNFVQERLLGEAPLSILEFERSLQRIAQDPRPVALILHLQTVNMPLAYVQAVRDALLRLRQADKRVICYAQAPDFKAYYLASAADEIVVPPSAALFTLGLQWQQVYLKDALDTIGVSYDVVAITPYKSAAETLTNTEPSPENREQFEWLIGSIYDMMVAGIAEGRGMSAEAVRQMIDQAPHTDQSALAAGYIDGIGNEEELRARLGVEHILMWDEAQNQLLLPNPQPQDAYIAVLGVSGTIVTGESQRPPVDVPLPFVGGEQMGDLTVQQQIRQVMRDKNAKALVFFVDSGGGSASASEAMTASLQQLAQDRPVVVCMGSTAASGGYYIATPAQHIVAYPGTLTGSIGVIAGKAVLRDLWSRLRLNPVTYQRGDNADWLSSEQAFTESQRERMRAFIDSIYQQFVAHVASSRGLTPEAVDAIGGGRVWTGAQALDNGLVDDLGGLHAAIEQARQLADLPQDTPVSVRQFKDKPIPAQLAERANPAASLRHLERTLSQLGTAQPLFMLPYQWRF